MREITWICCPGLSLPVCAYESFYKWVSGPVVERGPYRRQGKQSGHLFASWPCYWPLKKQSTEPWGLGRSCSGLPRSLETSGHCWGKESGSDSQASRLFF